MKLKNNYGKTAIEISSVRVKDEVLVIKGEALGTMPITVNVTADDMWEAREFITGAVIRKVVVLFFKGWRQSHKASRRPERTEKSA
jgi:hypothetical protein